MAENITQSILDINLKGPEAALDPYPLYDQVRTHDPVHWNQADNTWYVMRYADLMTIIRDDRLSSERFKTMVMSLSEEEKKRYSPFIESVLSWILMSDPPAHTRIRSLVNKAFTPRMIENMRTRIQTLVDGMLDKVQGNGRMDVIADLAVPLPGIVISDMLGVPEEGQPQFKKWSNDIARGLEGFDGPVSAIERLDMGQKSLLELSDYFRGIIKNLKEQPKDNLLNSLVEVEEAGDRLTEQEIVANCVMIMFAGNETTTNLIGNGILALLQNPEQKQLLQEDSGLIGSAVEELLRFDPPIQKTRRTAKVDIDLGGKTIRAGDLIAMCYGSANRDPEQFEEPNRLDITRVDNRHASFAQGIHYCLGAALARIEGPIAIGTLLSRMPGLKLETNEVERNPSLVFWGLKALPVSF